MPTFLVLGLVQSNPILGFVQSNAILGFVRQAALVFSENVLKKASQACGERFQALHSLASAESPIPWFGSSVLVLCEWWQEKLKYDAHCYISTCNHLMLGLLPAADQAVTVHSILLLRRRSKYAAAV